MSCPPEIFVVAGPNGAGKSTTATVLLPEGFNIDCFVNPDSIAATLSPGATAIDAGRVMMKRIRKLREDGETFAFETTLAARCFAAFLEDAKRAGYIVHVLFVWLRSVELARLRVADRVREGGHDVPPSDIERRYWRGLRNFFALYQPLADTWALCDNSGERPVVVAHARRGSRPIILDDEAYARIRHAAKQSNDRRAS